VIASGCICGWTAVEKFNSPGCLMLPTANPKERRQTMSPGNTLVTVLVVGALLFGSNAAAFTRADSKKSPSEKPGRVPDGANRIEKTTELLQRVEEGILYTTKSQYELTGVKVIDRGGGNRSPQTIGGRQRVVEMTFVDGVLKEVVIHK